MKHSSYSFSNFFFFPLVYFVLEHDPRPSPEMGECLHMKKPLSFWRSCRGSVFLRTRERPAVCQTDDTARGIDSFSQVISRASGMQCELSPGSPVSV